MAETAAKSQIQAKSTSVERATTVISQQDDESKDKKSEQVSTTESSTTIPLLPLRKPSRYVIKYDDNETYLYL